MDEVKRMWEQYMKMHFPNGYGGKEVAGICVAGVDTFAGGCVHTFILQRGRLDIQRIQCLQGCAHKLEIVVPLLEGNAKVYFEHLLIMSRKVLEMVA